MESFLKFQCKQFFEKFWNFFKILEWVIFGEKYFFENQLENFNKIIMQKLEQHHIIENLEDHAENLIKKGLVTLTRLHRPRMDPRPVRMGLRFS